MTGAERQRRYMERLRAGKTAAKAGVSDAELTAARARIADLEARLAAKAGVSDARRPDEARGNQWHADVMRAYRFLLKHHQGVLTPAEFKKILFCLHPDQAALRSAKQLGDVFELFNSKRMLLLTELPKRQSSTDLPKTVEELRARARAAFVEREAKAKQRAWAKREKDEAAKKDR